MRSLMLILVCFLLSSVFCFSGDYEIIEIKPIFNEATPGFGKFKIQVLLKSQIERESSIPVVCIYSGLTKPGVYFKDQPKIIRSYKQIILRPFEEKTIIFDKGFVAYHPEALGEIVVSIAGKGAVQSLSLQSRFHPNSELLPVSGSFSSPDRITNTPDPSVWKGPRLFHHRFQNKFNSRIHVSKCRVPPISMTPVYSKNQGYYFMTGAPDFSQKPPWSTSVYIYTEKEKWTRVKLLDHTAYPVQIKWINEKLIFIRVWWGRLVGTDLIFDVESGTIINKEMVKDGRILYKQHHASKMTLTEKE